MLKSQRTYGRKRKDTAAEKFDAVFGRSDGKLITIELQSKSKKLKKDDTHCTIISKSEPEPNQQKKANGKLQKSLNTHQSQNNLRSETYEPSLNKQCRKTRQNSADKVGGNEHRSNMKHTLDCTGSKYDKLFQKHEESASLKFDQIMGIPAAKSSVASYAKSKPQKAKTSSRKSRSSSVIPDHSDTYCFGFEDISHVETNSYVNRKETKAEDSKSQLCSSPSSMGKITGATMSTVGGRVVLNIQRGVNKSPIKTNSECSSPTKSVQLIDINRKSPATLQEKTLPSPIIKNNHSSGNLKLSTKVEFKAPLPKVNLPNKACKLSKYAKKFGNDVKNQSKSPSQGKKVRVLS